MGYDKIVDMFYDFNVMADITIEDLADLAVRYAVIRCRDCRYFEPSQTIKSCGWCCYFDSKIEDDGYCSNGKVKEDD